MTILSQQDPRWAHFLLGNSNLTIGAAGCVITCIAMILGVTPDVVNEKLRNVGGFDGGLVIWSKLTNAFPGISARYQAGYNNADALQNVPNVIVQVPARAIAGDGDHWIEFIGNHNCNDPWTGRQRPNQDFLAFGGPFAYVVISGKLTTTTPGDDVLLNEIQAVVNGSNDPHTKITQIRAILTS